MLTLTPLQWKRFQRDARDRFEQRLDPYLRDRFPSRYAGCSNEYLRQHITAGIDRAIAYGLSKRGEIRAFFGFLAVYGDDFPAGDDIAWASRILLRRHLSGAEKLTLLEQAELGQLRRQRL